MFVIPYVNHFILGVLHHVGLRASFYDEDLISSPSLAK